MADPFEVRMRFTGQLQKLNASMTSAQKAAHHALKYRDMGEDLHSCILEQLETSNMNIRANLMYFIEYFLDTAQKNGNTDYVRMIQRDIIRIVDAVAPDDGSGAANVKVVRKVLNGLRGKSLLEAQVVAEIEEVLKERDAAAQDMGVPAAGGGGPGYVSSQAAQAQARRPGPQKLDRRQVEQRIEEDRERHKLQREGIWAVPPGPNAERDKLWEETSDFGDDDHILGREEFEEREMCLRASCPHCRGPAAVEGEPKAYPLGARGVL